MLSTVQFSNGDVKSTDQLDFKYYKNVLASNPRKRNRRILVNFFVLIILVMNHL